MAVGVAWENDVRWATLVAQPVCDEHWLDGLQGREHPVDSCGSGGLDAYSRFLDICFDPPFQHAFHPVWPRKAAGDRRG